MLISIPDIMQNNKPASEPDGLFRRGDAEADGAGHIRVFPHHLKNRRKVRLNLRADAGDAQAGDDIEKSFRRSLTKSKILSVVTPPDSARRFAPWITGSSAVIEMGVLRSDARVIQSRGDGVDRCNLPVFILAEVGLHAVEDAQLSGGDGGRRLRRIHAPARGLAADKLYFRVADKTVVPA